jgi:MFS family permease
MMVAGIVAGMLFNRLGGRILSIIAAAVLTGGYFFITHLQVDTPWVFITICLLCIGSGLGLIISPVFNMIMTSAPRKYQGMVSSLTSLERFAPMTIGIALYNVIFVQGMKAIATHYDVTQNAPKLIQLKVLTAGFDLTFFISFLFGILILVCTILVRYRIHPDYLDSDVNETSGGFL